jgi:hypothetical protein
MRSGKLLLQYLVLLLVAGAARAAAAASGREGDRADPDSWWDDVAQRYRGMSPRGQFAAGAAVGFVGARLAVSTAVTFVKVAGAAFVA